MKSSKPSHIPRADVELLVEKFEEAILEVLNAVENIAEVNTQSIDGSKYIKASKFRMQIRTLRVEIAREMKDAVINNPPQPPGAA